MNKFVNILVVDDDELICCGLEKLMAARKLNVTTVNNGREAISRLGNADFHTVFLDINLPDANGLDILKEIKRLSPGTKVFMMTADDNDLNRRKALEEGALHLIRKPFSVSEIETVISGLAAPKQALT